jgi:tripartite-type tricarboxylate transporter receptor subunit TctC
MKTLSRRSFAITAIALAGATAALAADPFPSKPVLIVVTSAAGGWVDVTMRFVAQYMGDKLGQPVIVENRAGAGGLVALRTVKSAQADGYTLLASANTIAVQQAVSKDPGYNLVKDYTAIGGLARAPYLLMVGPSQTDNTLSDFVTRVKSNPGKLTYASAGEGSTTHLGTASFLQRAGLDIVHVPYKGNSAAWPDVISGRVNMILEPYGTAGPMIRDGRLKALGVSSTKRMNVLPDVPTMAEQGAPGYSFYLWLSLVAPVGTPKDVVQKLSVALRNALATPQVIERLRAEGSEAIDMSPEEFNRFLAQESAAITKLVSDVKLTKQ